MKLKHVIVFTIIFSLLSIQVAYMEEGIENGLVNMDIATENEYLALYVDQETAEVAVENKLTGKLWFSNPQNRNLDSIAGVANKERLSSQFSISYYTGTAQLKQMNSYQDSVKRGQFDIVNIDNGVRINYRLGKEEVIHVLPMVISDMRLEELVLNKLPETDQSKIKRNYRVLSLEKAKTDSDKQSLIDQYPTIEVNDLYVLSDAIKPYMIEELEALFLSVGYTLEDMNQDHVQNNVPIAESNLEVFHIPVEYILDGENLVISVPTKEINYNHESFPLYRLQLQEYFGAADLQQEGYMFVPDGSGSLIYLNNNKQKAQVFTSDVYGVDRSLPLPERNELIEQAYLPVYGMKQGDEAFFVIIEEGDAVARIWADVSRRVNSYNSVYSEFTLISRDGLNIGNYTGNNTIMVHQQRIIDSDIKLRYAFLSGDDANYAGMARYYQDYLVANGSITRVKSINNVPFYLETVGAIDKSKPILGIPIKQIHPLTTYKETIDMIKELKDSNISNIVLRYSGWMNGGVKQGVPFKIKLLSKLGGVNGFRSLVSYLADEDILFYPEVGLMYANNKILDSFITRLHASRNISKIIATVAKYDPATFLNDAKMGLKYVVSPFRLPTIIESLLQSLTRLNINGVALTDAGKDVNSDFKEGRLVDRQQASDMLRNELSRAKDSDMSMMIDGANAYALPYASHILNMPTSSNQFMITDETIPFYQLVIRGFVDYAGKPLNLAPDYREAFLNAVETGSGIYFKWIYEDNSAVKHTDYDYLFSCEYDVWLQEAIDVYSEFNTVFGDTQGQRIINHEVLMKNVFKTTFEQGKEVIVNYNKESVEIDGFTISGRDYKIVEEGN